MINLSKRDIFSLLGMKMSFLGGKSERNSAQKTVISKIYTSPSIAYCKAPSFYTIHLGQLMIKIADGCGINSREIRNC